MERYEITYNDGEKLTRNFRSEATVRSHIKRVLGDTGKMMFDITSEEGTSVYARDGDDRRGFSCFAFYRRVAGEPKREAKP